MRTRTQYMLIASALTLATGCHRMMTIKADNPNASIYFDGVYLGKGKAKVTRMGTPKRSEIRVEHHGESRTKVVSRDFTLVTLGLGLVSLYTGFFWAWEFPEDIELQAPSGSMQGDNPWLKPLSSSHGLKQTEQPNSVNEAERVEPDPHKGAAPRDPWLSPM